jgi:hypothetical protein
MARFNHLGLDDNSGRSTRMGATAAYYFGLDLAINRIVDWRLEISNVAPLRSAMRNGTPCPICSLLFVRLFIPLADALVD